MFFPSCEINLRLHFLYQPYNLSLYKFSSWASGSYVLLYRPTVDLVIFACLDFREFVILWLYTKSRIREITI